MLWTASHGDRLGVTGFSTLGGGTTLEYFYVGDIFGYVSDSLLRCWKGSWGVGTMPGIGNSDPKFFVCATCISLV